MQAHPAIRLYSNPWPRRLVGALLALTFQQSSAAYIAIDDDLLPAITSAPAKAQTQEIVHFTIPFTKERSTISDAGRAALNVLIPQMEGATIRIVGKPDAMIYTKGKIALLATNRANNIRDYLAKQGVPVSSIVVEIDNSPNPQTVGTVYPCDIYIARGDSAALLRQQAQHQQAIQWQDEIQSKPKSNTSDNRVVFGQRSTLDDVAANAMNNSGVLNSTTISYINKAVKSGQMDPAVAAKILRITVDNESVATQSVPVQSAQQSLPVTRKVQKPPVSNTTTFEAMSEQNQEVMVPISSVRRVLQTVSDDNFSPAFVNRLVDQMVSMNYPAEGKPDTSMTKPVTFAPIQQKQVWKVDASKTLRENIVFWSAKAGWNQPDWRAKDEFKTSDTTYVEGDFPDVLRQATDGSGLNVCAIRNSKTVRVTDHNIPCEKN